MQKPHRLNFVPILLILTIFTAGCAISTSSEPVTVDEATFQPNQAQLQERAAAEQAAQQPQETEEPTEPEADGASENAETVTDDTTTESDAGANTDTVDAPGPQETEEPADAPPAEEPSPYADEPVVIDRAWFIISDITDEGATVQNWFFISNNTSQPYSDDGADGIAVTLPAAASDVSVQDTTTYSVVEGDAAPRVVSNAPLPAQTTSATLLTVNYQLSTEDLAAINFTLDYPVEQFIVYTPLQLRPQREVPEYEYVEVALIRTLGEFLRFQQDNIDAGTPISFSVQESDEVRFPEDTSFTDVTVTVANQTEGGTVPDGLEITAASLQVGDQNTVTQLYEETLPNNPDGVTFAGVPYVENGFVEFVVEYNDISFFSRLDGLEIDGEQSELTLSIYETTTDSSVLALDSVQYLGDAVSGEGLADFINSFYFINTSDRVYIGTEGNVLRIPLPENVTGQQLPIDLGEEVRVDVDDDQRFFLVDDRVIYPDERHFTVVRYVMSYDGELDFTHQLPFPINQVIAYTAESRALNFDGDGFTPQGMNNIPQFGNYETYIREGVAANSLITFTVSDSDETPQFTGAAQGSTGSGNTNATQTTVEDDESFLVENRILILGIGILIVLAGGGYLLYDLQKERIRAGATATATTGASTGSSAANSDMDEEQKQLLREIAELDSAFENGEIDEDVYRERRKSLKNQLMDRM